uniref:BESS domain-containing protein n=1 Tax=Sphaeramia orbicularis TaxID=375764 RepID=A0A672ZTB1_9TELE
MRLILSVFNYPELYNVTLPNYRCTDSRTNAWRSISVLLGLPCECCKRKWKNMRDRYLKEVRMEIKSKKQGEVVQSRWKYRQLMNFITPQSGMKGPGGQNDIKPQVAFVAQLPSGSTDAHMTQMMPPLNKPGRKRRLMNEALSMSTSQTTSAPTKWPHKDHASSFPNRPRDEDELFLLSFVPALKRLAPQKRCETKMKIQQIMYEAEFNVAQPETHDKPPPEADTQD